MFSVGNGKEFLQPEQMTRLSSIVATHEAERTSDKYNFFSTMNIVNMLAKEKWLPVAMQEQNVRLEDRKGFQKHMIRFRRPGETLKNVGDLAPEIILTNSHDALSAYQIMAGIFRLACLNGMIVSEAEFSSIHVRHLGFKEEDVIDATYKVIEEVPKLTDKIGQYKAITLNPEERFAFAESALVTKFANDDETQAEEHGGLVKIEDRTFNLQKLLQPRRTEDQLPTLWNTFNIIQEKFTKGNDYEQTTRISDVGKITRKTKVSGIRGINENIRVNRGLWQLTELMRELKAQPTA
jgi:hypothetical protein